MHSSPETSQSTKLINQFWDIFFLDKFSEALEFISEKIDDKKLASKLKAKVYLKQGLFKKSFNEIKNFDKNDGFRVFVEFLISAEPKSILPKLKTKDTENNLYIAQVIYICRLYWGEDFLEESNCKIDPDSLISECFNEFLDAGLYDKAILASVQSLEINLEEQILSSDLQLPIVKEQLDNLIKLADKAKFNSTKAKIYLIRAKLFRSHEDLQDAEILFGKEKNINGLGEVYLSYAKDFNKDEYFEKALKQFIESGNLMAQGFVHEALAAKALNKGLISEAEEFSQKSYELLQECGAFENYGLQMQKISINALKGKYQKVKEAIHEILEPSTPPFFIAQAYQILSNTVLQLGEGVELARGYIESSVKIFRKLKRYSQLLYALNIYFQILLLEDKNEAATNTGNEIIHLANRLGHDEIKASKYLDLAFLSLKSSLEQDEVKQSDLDQASQYFKQATEIYQEQEDFIGEADTYQAMGNMYASIGKLEDALKAFLHAKKLYQEEGALMQAAITDLLIGVMMLSFLVINEQTYPIASTHLEQAMLYFSNEKLLDLNWKALFYLADLNHRYYFMDKDNKADLEICKNKAKKFYLEMLYAIEEYQKETSSILFNQADIVGISLEEAFNKAYQFFLSIDEKHIAERFRKDFN